MSRGVAVCAPQRIEHRGALRLPDFERVVLDPAGTRKVLGEFALRLRDDAAAAASNNSERELVVPWSSARTYRAALTASAVQADRPRGLRPAAR